MPVPRFAAGLAAGLLALLTSCASAPVPGRPPEPTALLGKWRVDLRPTPGADAYYQEFIVTEATDGLRGSFYGSAIDNGRVNRDWGTLHFAFTTTDGAGVYHTTGELDGERLRGTTHSLGRGFLAVWTATRSD